MLYHQNVNRLLLVWIRELGTLFGPKYRLWFVVFSLETVQSVICRHQSIRTMHSFTDQPIFLRSLRVFSGSGRLV